MLATLTGTDDVKTIYTINSDSSASSANEEMQRVRRLSRRAERLESAGILLTWASAIAVGIFISAHVSAGQKAWSLLPLPIVALGGWIYFELKATTEEHRIRRAACEAWDAKNDPD